MTETLSPALPRDLDRFAHETLRLASAKQLTLVTAESCTGGLLSSLLTDIDGLGSIFERGFVTYSEEAKCDLLGLSQAMIDDCGVVSEAVARAMAQGALKRSSGDIAIAVTGFAGPAGPDDEAGLIHFACARRDGGIAHREVHLGPVNRGTARIACMRIALEMLQDAINA